LTKISTNLDLLNKDNEKYELLYKKIINLDKGWLSNTQGVRSKLYELFNEKAKKII
jgi:hypothetical protein